MQIYGRKKFSTGACITVTGYKKMLYASSAMSCQPADSSLIYSNDVLNYRQVWSDDRSRPCHHSITGNC